LRALRAHRYENPLRIIQLN
jgi:mRNA interferase HicA